MRSAFSTRQALVMHCVAPHTAHGTYPAPLRTTLPATLPNAPRSRALIHTSHIARAKTASMDLEIGMSAPPFSLLEPMTGKTVSLSDFDGAPGILIVFMCNHCPFVKMLKTALVDVATEYQAKGVATIAISSNSVQTHPQDGPEEMAKDAKEFGYPFPYLFDESQAVAQAYRAACTPEFYVFDAQQRLRYHGQFDDARPTNGVTPSGRDVRAALDAVLAGREVPPAGPSLGCNIKWHPGNEPSYFGQTAV